ncbi:MAG: hypothetical protein HY263_03160 [Chloroflexi bacterium]|nr:hypothetical protein [Chloroflexota bacterium]
MPVQRLPPGSHPRARGFRDGLSAAAVVVILALAGGVVAFPGLTAGPTTISSAGGVTTTSSPAASLPPSAATASDVISAVVTPAADCVPEDGTPPVGTLRITGNHPVRLVRGTIVDPTYTSNPMPLSSVLAADVVSGEALDIVTARRCAVEWQISYDFATLEQVTNPRHDPRYAAQDDFRFSIASRLAEHGSLVASLRFGAALWTYAWAIRLAPYPLDQLHLLTVVPSSDGDLRESSIAMLIGRGTELTFQTGASVPSQPLSEPAANSIPVLRAAPGATIRARLDSGDFLRPENPYEPVIECGTLSEGTGKLDPLSGCELRYVPDDPSSFRLPDAPGVWVVAVHGCIDDAVVKACGAWYATVDTQSAGWTAFPGS